LCYICQNGDLGIRAGPIHRDGGSTREICEEGKEITGEILGVKPHAVELLRAVKEDYCLIKRFLSIRLICLLIRHGGSITEKKNLGTF
jgi:hypothetical protein